MYLENAIPLVPYASVAPVPYISDDLIFDLWKSLYLSSNGPNFIFSPYSVISALMMLLLGSNGHTQLQLARALFGQGFNGSTWLNQHVAQFDKWNRKFLDETLNKVQIGNFIYSQQEFKPNYTQTISKLVKANATLVDFANPNSTIERINWDMSRVTNGSVPNFLSNIENNNATLLLNTLYFNSRWAVEFNPNSTDTAGTFWIRPNKSVKAAMMHHETIVIKEDYLGHGYSYYRNPESGLEAVKIPYSEEEYSLVIILPPENITMRNYIRDQFNAATFNAIFNNFRRYAFRPLIIPRFKLSLKHSLKSTLRTLGITDVFESDAANFSEMFQGGKLAVVSEIMQSALIEFHETGTRPVESGWYECYTFEAIDKAPPFTEFKANRPFLFAIVREQSDKPTVKQFLFAGVVDDPTV